MFDHLDPLYFTILDTCHTAGLGSADVPVHNGQIVNFQVSEGGLEVFALKSYNIRAISPQLSARAFPRHRGTII